MAELHLDGVFLLVKLYILADLLNDEASGDDTLIAELLIGRVYIRCTFSIEGRHIDSWWKRTRKF